MTPNSRSYLNHFTQPDSIVPDPYNSQDYDRYAYARYNPLRYTDPSGHVPCDEDGVCYSPSKQTNRLYRDGGWDEHKGQLEKMKPGDLISFIVGDIQYNFMAGLMEDGKTVGFWNLDGDAYLSFDVTKDLFELSSQWTIFSRTDDRGFTNYEVTETQGEPLELGAWTLPVADENSDYYIQIETEIDLGGLSLATLDVMLLPISGAYSAMNGNLNIKARGPEDITTIISSSTINYAWEYIKNGDYIEQRIPIIVSGR